MASVGHRLLRGLNVYVACHGFNDVAHFSTIQAIFRRWSNTIWPLAGVYVDIVFRHPARVRDDLTIEVVPPHNVRARALP